MSLGYTGICKKVAEDDSIVIYSYAGENWNDGGKSKRGDLHLQDGMFTIYKDHVFIDIENCMQSGGVKVDRECKNSMATDEQRKQMMEWHQEHRNPEWPGGVENMDHIFQSLTLANIPVRGNLTVKFLNQVPCFLYEGEWITFPKRGGLYYDFVEETAVYKEAEPIIEELIKERLGELYDHMGACHAIWYHRKRLLMEKYGIEWFTPVELNPEVIFD